MKRIGIVTAIAASLVSAAVFAHWDGSNPGHGPGNGMMGGWGMGAGMGMGPGPMMGGPEGRGPCGAAGNGPGFAAGLDLTDEQRAKIADIRRETHADARARIEAVLTDEQRQKLGKAGPGPRW
ncbi:MAG TPA: hypothetical protein VFJ62_15820 [Usitatibacter sp.]|nr:hypothetical protein [Usitatibacter sp.]